MIPMSKVVNLRLVRKQAARAAKRTEAAENAVRHGRSKAERALQQTQAAKARAHLDAHARERKE